MRKVRRLPKGLQLSFQNLQDPEVGKIAREHFPFEPSYPDRARPEKQQPNKFQCTSLIPEAAAFGEGGNENESLEAKAQKALGCPCIADLRNGSCGSQFTETFRCFLMSTPEEKGSDCVHPFVALQSCIKANPSAFSKEILEDEKKEEQQPVQPDHRNIPPLWAKDTPRRGKSKL